MGIEKVVELILEKGLAVGLTLLFVWYFLAKYLPRLHETFAGELEKSREQHKETVTEILTRHDKNHGELKAAIEDHTKAIQEQGKILVIHSVAKCGQAKEQFPADTVARTEKEDGKL